MTIAAALLGLFTVRYILLYHWYGIWPAVVGACRRQLQNDESKPKCDRRAFMNFIKTILVTGGYLRSLINPTDFTAWLDGDGLCTLHIGWRCQTAIILSNSVPIYLSMCICPQICAAGVAYLQIAHDQTADVSNVFLSALCGCHQ